MRGRFAWIGCVVVCLAPRLAASQSSVDCGAMSEAVVDRLVCRDAGLLEMDAAFGRAYAAAKAAGVERQSLLTRVQADLKWREKNCRDTACLEEWYRSVTPQYQAIAANAKRSGGGEGAAIPGAGAGAPLRNRPAPDNVAVAQCRVVRGMVTSVPMWRDNGVPWERIWLNIAGPLSAFAPDPTTYAEWERAMNQLYKSRVAGDEVRVRYESLCDQYIELHIPAPKPR